MNVTATLFGQVLTFAVLVLFIKAVLWEPMTRMLEERKKRIADGLAAGERGQREHELAEKRAKELLHDAHEQANGIIAQAQQRAATIIDESKNDARAEGERILHAARSEIDQELNRAKEELRMHFGGMVALGASKVLEREVDAAAHDKLITDLVAQI